MSSTTDQVTNSKTVGVVGAGTMGRGIVQLFAQAGHQVIVYDAQEGAANAAIEFVVGMIKRGVEKGRMAADVADSIISSISSAADLQGLSACDLVVVAIIENIDIKQGLFLELEEVVSSECILASNTSSLTVSEIAAKCEYPERLAGLHFFNPVPLMKVAEVIAAVKTSDQTVAALVELVSGAGHRAVVAADQPGFLVNHAGRGLYTEGLRIIEEQVATVEDVDTVMREAAGFKMGPFELLDLTGLDVSSKVMTSIYEQFYQEPRFRPSALIAPRVAAGLFGRKTGEGWYRYKDNKKVESNKLAAPNLPKPAADVKVFIDSCADDFLDLTALLASAGVEVIDQAANADLILVQPWGQDASSYAVDNDLDATITVGLDPLPGLDKHRTLMLTSVTTETARDLAHALLTSDEVAATVINDSPGFICQRVLATIVNIATEIAQRGIASVEDIEDAVRLGLGYPMGPLAIGESIGGDRVLSVLEEILDLSGDPRYRPSRWLARRVELDVPLTQAEAARV